MEGDFGKLKRLKLLIILIILLFGVSIFSIAYANTNIQSALQIDTNLENAVFDKSGIHIEGWKLATEPNTKLVVLIDGQKVDDNYIKYSRKYDLISIIKGYGTYAENPLPNYDVDIPTTNISDGKHNLKIQFISQNGTVLKNVETIITVEKVRHALQLDTNLSSTVFGKSGIHIEGWKLATEPNTKLEVLIDGQKVDDNYIKYSRKYDLISIIKGYGTYTENPLPNYDVDIPTTNISDGKHNIKIQFVLQDGTILESIENTITVEKVKHLLQVDTILNNVKFDKYGIHIEGWKLATEPNTKLIVLIDGQEVENNIIYSYKYDLISIIKGYGTYAENPKPNYDIYIPTKEISNGKHSLRIQFVLQDGTILESVTNTIIIDKSIKSILTIDTNLDAVIFNENRKIHISGWKLATEEGTKLAVLVDGQKIDEDCITYSRKYDLISIVKGYGTYEENPLPNFDINIPTEKLSWQNHKVKIQFVAPDGKTVLKNVEFTAIYGDKYNGIDVSQHNGNINWKQVATSGVDFAIIRLGYRGYRNPICTLDSKALYNIKEAKSAGLKVGIYFVTQAVNLEEAQEEALWVISQIHQNKLQIDFPISIDVEDSGARSKGELPGRADLLSKETRTLICRGFCDVIRYYGYTPMIYANYNYFNNYLNFSELSIYDIWLAHFTYDETVRSNFAGEYQMWQYSDKGTVWGINTETDLNSCYKKY